MFFASKSFPKDYLIVRSSKSYDYTGYDNRTEDMKFDIFWHKSAPNPYDEHFEQIYDAVCTCTSDESLQVICDKFDIAVKVW